MKEVILVKFGEMALKGLNKRSFESVLLKQLKERLRSLGDFQYTNAQSTIYITPSDSLDDRTICNAVERVSKVFGIAALSRACVCEKTIEDIMKKAVEYTVEDLEDVRTFKVDAKRADKRFPMNSPEICREVGAALIEKHPHLKVDMKHPQATIMVEVRDSHAYVYAHRIKGAGGLPVGTSGKAMLLLSGGIDSPVAGVMMAKRGLRVSAIHFVSPPYTSDRARLKVEQLCEKMTEYCGPITFYCVPFTELQEEIKRSCPEDYFTIIMRRLMMEIAQRIAEKDESSALITGESVGQVASQTLPAMVCTDAVCRCPVLRPLVGMDKTEIIEIARNIDTFETSILPYEDCCTVFTPKHPRLRPSLEEVEQAQAKGNFDKMVTKAVEETDIKRFQPAYFVK